MIQVAQSRLLPHLTPPVIRAEKKAGPPPRGRRSTHRDPKIRVGQALFQFPFNFALSFNFIQLTPKNSKGNRKKFELSGIQSK